MSPGKIFSNWAVALLAGLIALAQSGARPVGLDFSSQQLKHARRLMEEAGIDFPLIEASAEDVPLPDASFDIVFCHWGAMTFCDPQKTVPEVARLLRPGDSSLSRLARRSSFFVRM